ncbi:MAG TPA: hypothetical protein PLZ36_10985 [Armatimonadota bacterium]|nr:hypothetical protein [Armatimonadota bacterium]
MAPVQRNERQKPFHERIAAQTSKVETLRKAILAAAAAEYGIQNPLAQEILAQAEQDHRDVIEVLMEWFLLHRACRHADSAAIAVYRVEKHARLPQGLTMKRIKGLRLP